MQYGESLPLNDHEVVLTFDDGPLPPYTNRVLDTLASECVKATFFMVGRMVRGYPAVVRRVYNEGHTVANHSQSHPFTFHRMTVDQAAREIEDGFASLQAALGDRKAVAPFFRIPGLLRQNSVEQYLAAHGDMTWSVDFLADDWTHINNREVARREAGLQLVLAFRPIWAIMQATTVQFLIALAPGNGRWTSIPSCWHAFSSPSR